MRAMWVVLAIAACSPYDDDLGRTPFLCGEAEPRCPTGYTCAVDPDDGREVCTDMPPPEFVCADDSASEPNESIIDATATSIGTASTFSLDGLAICPDGDRDVFALQLAAAADVEVLVTFQEDGATLAATVVDSVGTTIAGAAPLDGMPTTIRALAAGLPPGTYFVEVDAPATSFRRTNNYSIRINLNP